MVIIMGFVFRLETEKQECYRFILMVIKRLKALKVSENGIGNFKKGIQWQTKLLELLLDGYGGA